MINNSSSKTGFCCNDKLYAKYCHDSPNRYFNRESQG